MGHYLSEMDGYPRRRDPYDYKKVRELGFVSVSLSSFSGASPQRCPGCFLLVEGEFAEKHWAVAHAKEVVYSYIATDPRYKDGNYWAIGVTDHEGAAHYAWAYPDLIVMAIEVEE